MIPGNRRILVLLIAGLIATISLLSLEPTRNFLKSVPGTMEVLALIHNSLNPAISPEKAGNGSHASKILLIDPAGVAQDSDGNVYISDRVGLIWKVEVSGMAKVVAGTGRRGRARDGRSAIETNLGAPQGIAFDSEDRLHITDSVNNVVLRIESDGTMKRIAGTGFVGHRRDGGPAIDASLDEPFDIRFDSEDNLFIVEFGNNRIRKVNRQGVISTVAGSRKPGYSGDSGPAKSAQLRGPYGAYLDDKDHLYIADSGNNVIRVVDDKGIIRTVAGSQKQGYAGDGGPATDALMDSPQFVVTDEYGRIFVGDEHNRSIRVISPDGMISTLIGKGAAANAYQGPADAQEVVLNDPEALLLQTDGSLLIVDGGDARVIRLRADGTTEHYAGRTPPDVVSNRNID